MTPSGRPRVRVPDGAPTTPMGRSRALGWPRGPGGDWQCIAGPSTSAQCARGTCFGVAPRVVSCALSRVLLLDASSAQHAAHAVHTKERKACQEPNTALGALRKRSVGEDCRVSFCVGQRATSSVVSLHVMPFVAPPPPPAPRHGSTTQRRGVGWGGIPPAVPEA